jgi:hypothetical protein
VRDEVDLTRKAVISEILDALSEGQLEGVPLKHNFSGFLSVHFGRKPEMRLIYSRYDCQTPKGCKLHSVTNCEDPACEGLVDVPIIASREAMNQLYRLSKKDVDNLKRYLD